jgi:hypothetical protein
MANPNHIQSKEQDNTGEGLIICLKNSEYYPSNLAFRLHHEDFQVYLMIKG